MEIKTNDGRNVEVLLHCRTRMKAVQVAENIDDEPIDGYVLLKWSVSRRIRGGKLRSLKLLFRHTGSDTYPPLTDEQEWAELLQKDAEVARGR